jgi:hypothetical protein
MPAGTLPPAGTDLSPLQGDATVSDGRAGWRSRDFRTVIDMSDVGMVRIQ